MPAFGQTAFGPNRIWPRIWPICFLTAFGQTELPRISVSVDRIWCFSVLAKFSVIVFVVVCSWLLPVVACCCLLLPVVACWCLLVPVGACWCLLVVLVGGACWWCLLVVSVGGVCWWCLLVVLVGGAVGGACWWCLFVCVWWVCSRWASPPDPPPGRLPLDRPKFRSFFFSLSRRKIHSFFSLWVSILVVFLKTGTLCQPRRPSRPGRRGFTRQPENSKRAHLRSRRFRETPRERRKNEFSGGREKKARNFGPPTLRPPPFGPPPFGPPPLRAATFSGFGPQPLGAPTPWGPHPLGPPPLRGC